MNAFARSEQAEERYSLFFYEFLLIKEHDTQQPSEQQQTNLTSLIHNEHLHSKTKRDYHVAKNW